MILSHSEFAAQVFTTSAIHHTSAMSNANLPAELLDYIVEFLCDSRYALKCCCLVSKSWIPRARNHIFADIVFYTPEDLQSWKTVFPDPSTSPARYTQTLVIKCSLGITAADAEEGGWISAFSRIVRFEVNGSYATRPSISLTPFYGLSPVVKSLHLVYCIVQSSHVLDLIYLFPSLEDLSVTGVDRWTDSDDSLDKQPIVIQPSTLPAFTGSLDLHLKMGKDFIISWLLSLPGGLHFRKLRLRLNREKDTLAATALVERCRFTLESLEFEYSPACAFICHPRSHRLLTPV